MTTSERPRVGLFATCLIDAWRPSVGLAAAELLEQAGCEVDLPVQQTCCGQPAFNSGDEATTRLLACRVIETFEAYDYLVTPSGSCLGMLQDYDVLFQSDWTWRQRHAELMQRSHELLHFLDQVRGFRPTGHVEARVTYHDSCTGLRKLNIHAQPRRLLAAIKGLELVELPESDVCCGFGGTFCVKYGDISDRIVARKAAHIDATGAEMLLGGDLGCLLNMAGKLSRVGSTVRCFHTAEVLAGYTDRAIGEGA